MFAGTFLRRLQNELTGAIFHGFGAGRWLGAGRFHGRNRGAETSERFRNFLFPFDAAKSFAGGCIPAHGFFDVPHFLLKHTQLEGHHSIVSFFEEFREFLRGFGAVFRFANARLDLPPIGHGEAL
jgi:hypothetical protein